MVQDFTGKGYMTRTLRHIFDSFLLPPHLLNLHSLISALCLPPIDTSRVALTHA